MFEIFFFSRLLKIFFSKNFFLYFVFLQEQFPLGTVNLQICEGVLEDTNTKKNCFMVVTQPRTYKIVAPSRHEMAEWMVSIKNVIQDLTASNRPRSIEGILSIFKLICFGIYIANSLFWCFVWNRQYLYEARG